MSTGTRQLAAVMFADMVGYTALMNENEYLAREKRDHFAEVLQKNTDRFSGTLIQNYGDGALVIFRSALEGVRCAIHVQQQLQAHPKVEIRIGLHTGDIVMDNGNVFGDGVNIASRIESLAVPGSVFISEKFFEDIKNHEEIKTRTLGFFELKNVKQPLQVYAVANSGVIVPSREEVKGKLKTTLNSIAVIPLSNMSSDPENEFFCDGISEELINALTKVDGLQVISRISAFAFKGRNEDVREIAAKLNVQKIIEGSVRKSGNHVRITVQLINAADGFHFWSETYDRDLNDIFRVQDEISNTIANKLRAKLSSSPQKDSPEKPPTKNLEAYSVFLKGRYFNNKETPSDVLKAIDYYKEAMVLDPGFAMPYAFVAGAYGFLGSMGAVDAGEAFKQVHYYSDKALQLDDTLAEAYVAQGAAFLFYDWEWEEAYRALTKAMELNHEATVAHQVMGYYYMSMGQPQKAIDVLESAWQRDPLSMFLARTLGIAYFDAELYDDVIRLSDMQLGVMPEMWYAMALKGFAIGMKGSWEDALKIFEETNRLSGGLPMTLSYLAYCNGVLGRKEEAKTFLSQIENFQEAHPELAKYQDLVLAWWGIGDHDKTFEAIFKAIERKEELVSYMLNSPVYHTLRDDPRFEDVRKMLNQ